MREKAGRITGAGLSKEVTFEPVDAATNDRIDDAYRLKYQGSSYLSPMIGTRSRSATLADVERWPDTGLVREGLRLFKELPRTAPTEVLLATDLHTSSVLRPAREPWLVIDPKPFVGGSPPTMRRSTCSTVMRDCARTRSGRSDGSRTCLEGIASEFDSGRLPPAAEPRDDWSHRDSMTLARAIAP